jgi:sortase A
MRTRISNLKRLEIVLLAAGTLLVGYAAVEYIGGRLYSHAALAKFHAVSATQQEAGGRTLKSAISLDKSLWSEIRIREYEASMAAQIDDPVAVLRVQKIHLEVPVFDGTDDVILNRGVGRIVGTARVGQTGNVGIAGHRDGFFRGLKDVKLGDTMELETATGIENYVIDSIKVVAPNDVSALRNESTPALTLVTCYPFYFVGSAPQRYIVHASLRGELRTINEPSKASLQATASRTKEKTQ